MLISSECAQLLSATESLTLKDARVTLGCCGTHKTHPGLPRSSADTRGTDDVSKDRRCSADQASPLLRYDGLSRTLLLLLG